MIIPTYQQVLLHPDLQPVDGLIHGLLSQVQAIRERPPSYRWIGKQVGISAKTVQISMERLTKAGFLKIVKQPGGRVTQIQMSLPGMKDAISNNKIDSIDNKLGIGSQLEPIPMEVSTPPLGSSKQGTPQSGITPPTGQTPTDKRLFISRFMKAYSEIEDGRDTRYRLTPADLGALRVSGPEWPTFLEIQLTVSWLLKKEFTVSPRAVLNCYQSAKVESSNGREAPRPQESTTIPEYELEE